jgi:hypothetical protein
MRLLTTSTAKKTHRERRKKDTLLCKRSKTLEQMCVCVCVFVMYRCMCIYVCL